MIGSIGIKGTAICRSSCLAAKLGAQLSRRAVVVLEFREPALSRSGESSGVATGIASGVAAVAGLGLVSRYQRAEERDARCSYQQTGFQGTKHECDTAEEWEVVHVDFDNLGESDGAYNADSVFPSVSWAQSDRKQEKSWLLTQVRCQKSPSNQSSCTSVARGRRDKAWGGA